MLFLQLECENCIMDRMMDANAHPASRVMGSRLVKVFSYMNSLIFLNNFTKISFVQLAFELYIVLGHSYLDARLCIHVYKSNHVQSGLLVQFAVLKRSQGPSGNSIHVFEFPILSCISDRILFQMLMNAKKRLLVNVPLANARTHGEVTIAAVAVICCTCKSMTHA